MAESRLSLKSYRIHKASEKLAERTRKLKTVLTKGIADERNKMAKAFRQ